MKKIYEPFLLGKKDLIIVDMGQNIGITSYYFKDYARRVIGFEPSLQHRQVCSEMVKYNKIKNIETLPYAISNKNGTTKFYHNQNTTSFSLSLKSDDKDFEEVETITMAKVFEVAKIDKIDILKLDIEGEETKLIASPEFKDNVHRIPIILGEYHVWCGMEQNQFANMLIDLGYSFKWRNDTKAAVFEAVLL
jgi:FkbM family methyltransferase